MPSTKTKSTRPSWEEKATCAPFYYVMIFFSTLSKTLCLRWTTTKKSRKIASSKLSRARSCVRVWFVTFARWSYLHTFISAKILRFDVNSNPKPSTPPTKKQNYPQHAIKCLREAPLPRRRRRRRRRKEVNSSGGERFVLFFARRGRRARKDGGFLPLLLLLLSRRRD